MAKSNYELHDFSAGTITNGDAGDIPPGAAQDSLNISSISKLGVAQTIVGHLEINKDNETDVITGIPPISSMIVRDGDDNSYDLAVNIDKYFILVEKYRSDRLLGDFVGVVKKGQLLSTSPTDYTDIANWSLVSLTYSSPSLTLEAGYGYEISLGHVTTATLTTTPSTIKIKNADGTYAKFADGTDVKEFYDTTSIKEIFYAESDSTTVIELTKGTGTGTPSWEKPVRIQLSKAKYLFSELGTNIDMTETERGLFLSSTIKAPMVQHKIADSSGDIKKYLVTSKCATPTSVNALSNIDQMIWVKDNSGTEHRLICSIYGVNKIWQLVYNTTGATPYYEFNPSNVIAEMPKGVGGLVQTDVANTFYSWDFEGFNVHKLELPPTTTTVTSGFDVTVAKTYSISVEDIPDDGWIASVASAKAGNQSTDPILYVLFTRAGGLREEDNILVAINAKDGSGDYKSDANNNLKVLYKLPSYQSATAYTSHSFEKNWLGVRDDVNPTGPTDFYWTKESTAKLVPYRDGDFADITHYTKYGYAKDVCWINTASEPVSMDINEGGIVVTTQLDSNIDCVWFSAKPLGETKFLTYSGVWQEAKQWPNNWFDTSSDGEWTHQSEEQKFTRFNNFIGVASHDIGTSTSPTWSDIKEFSMKQVPATGPDIAKAWDDCYGYMIALEQATFPTEVVTNDNATTNSAKRWYVSDRSSHLEVLTNAQKEKIENDESDYTDNNKTSFSDVNLIASTGLLKLEQEVMKSGEWFNLKAKLKAFDTNIESAINSLRSNVLSKVKFTHKDVTGVRNSDGNYPNKTSDRILKFSPQFDNVSDGPLYAYRSLKSTYSALHNALQTVLGYADVKTIATLDPAQITHIPILGADAQDVLQKLNLTHLIDDVGFPFANPITQMQSYTSTGTKILFSSMGDGGIPTFAEATITSTGATPLQKLGNTILTFDDRHTAATGKMFTTPVTNAETGEVEDASEFWALYKPSGNDHAIKNVSGSGNDSDTDEGILVATYTGQLMLKNYEFTNTSTINGKFNSGDLVVGLKVDESASNTLVTPAGTVTGTGAQGDDKCLVTYTQTAGADIATGDTVTIADTTNFNGPYIIKDLDATAKTFVIDKDNVTSTTDETGTWSANVTDDASVPFKMNETYLYNMSFLYDGYQEGPLMATPVTVGPLAANYTALHIDVKLANSNPRVTDIQIYRKKTAAEKFRLVHSAKFNSDWSATTSGQSEMMSALEIGFKDYGDTGISYEALTGMPETLQSTNFDTYGESAQIGNYLFVANAEHPKLIDSQKMIFRSQPTKFSMFNWAQDYIGMPEKIYTLQSHNNRLYAWSKKAMYRIDPYQMLLEQTYEGMGLSGKQSCISIDGLMFIANKNAIYMFNAGRFRKISQTIEDRYNALWKKYPNQKVILSQDKRYNSLLVKFSNQGPNSIDYAPTESFAYSLDKNRWDIWSLPARVTASCINEDNELMICAESSNVVGQNANGESIDSEGAVITNPFSLYEMHRGSSKEPLSWTSKSLVFGEDGRDKKVKTIRLIGRDVVLESMIVDGEETLFSSTVDSVTKPIIATSNSGDSKSDSYFQEWRLNQLKDPHTGNKIDYTIKRARAIALKIRSLNTLDDNSSEALEPSIASIGVTWSPKSFK